MSDDSGWRPVGEFLLDQDTFVQGWHLRCAVCPHPGQLGWVRTGSEGLLWLREHIRDTHPDVWRRTYGRDDPRSEMRGNAIRGLQLWFDARAEPPVMDSDHTPLDVWAQAVEALRDETLQAPREADGDA